jgi:hypothetical protein
MATRSGEILASLPSLEPRLRFSLDGTRATSAFRRADSSCQRELKSAPLSRIEECST